MADYGLMRMSAKNGGEAGCRGIEIQFLETMQHVEVEAAESGYFGGRQLSASPLRVNVAANGSDRRNRRKSVKNIGLANIAAMQNVIAAAQQRLNLWTK